MPTCTPIRNQLLRGAAGLAAATGSFLLFTTHLWPALALLAAAAIFWRGCPTCWTFGLLGVIKKQKAAKAAKPPLA